MNTAKANHAALRRNIAKKVRALRQDRHLSQAALAAQLGLSQNRLSEVERGGGSFTAEQFLTLLKLFNATIHDFVGPSEKPDTELQNALARLGAGHLRESDAVWVSERIASLHEAIRQTLVDASSPRAITALAPVVVSNIARLNLTKLHADLTLTGFAQRLGWLLDSVLSAVRMIAPTRKVRRPWRNNLIRAEFVLSTFLGAHPAPQRSEPDVLDPGILSTESLREVAAASSDLAQHWGVVTSIQTVDFVAALEAALESA